MKDYPSIPRAVGQLFREIPGAYIFDKLDGSNLRFEWDPKKGWYKFGTRKCLMDENTPIFGKAIPLFMETMAEPLKKAAKDNRWEKLIVFCEFWGDKSFAGWREVYDKQGDLYPEDTRHLTLIDIAPHKKGILGPKDFMKTAEKYDLPIPDFLGIQNWTRGFVERVRNDEIDGVSFEGVIGKAGEGHKLIMAKAKTQKWIDKVLAVYGEEEGRKLVES